MEHIEEISQLVQQLKKKLAWSWVYSIDKELQQQSVKIGKLKDRIPTCQAKIDWEQVGNKLLAVLNFLCLRSIFVNCVINLFSIPFLLYSLWRVFSQRC